MLLNIEQALDKGEVALISAHLDDKMIQDIEHTYFKTLSKQELLDIATATFMLKCPIFIQLNLSKFDFKIISIPCHKTECYIPDISEIPGKSLEDKKQIFKYLQQTTDALILNSKSLSMDSDKSFISDLTTPISVYTKLIVSGSINTWLSFLFQKNMPKPLQVYRDKIANIIKVNWKRLEKLND